MAILILSFSPLFRNQFVQKPKPLEPEIPWFDEDEEENLIEDIPDIIQTIYVFDLSLPVVLHILYHFVTQIIFISMILN